MKRTVLVPLLLAICSWAAAQARYSASPGVPWPATDGLGRKLPLANEVGAPRPDRFVGIFYFLWLGQHQHGPEGPSVVTEIMKMFPNALETAASPPWGPPGSMYYWGEPLFGFYLANDPWVIRRHAMLLADAGIDTLIFDATNRRTYRDVYMRLCEVFRQIRREGGHTPQIVFMVNTEAGATAQEIYKDLYQPGLYEELWFRWQDKPLMIADPEKVSPEVRAFFTLRRAHWPFTQVDTKDAWHWEAAYPQVYGFTDDPKKPEQVNVSVAQNLRISDGKVTNMSNGDSRGRSFHNGSGDTSPGAINQGFNFAEQWTRALALEPRFVMVTGWNEWIAGRFSRPGKPSVFVDQFDEEHSRDIEMMKGGHLDHYYYQLVTNVRANVRRYKGVPEISPATPPKTIPLKDGFDAWREVGPDYLDHAGGTNPRDFDGVGKWHYTERSGLNDFDVMKVARDRTHVYFYARTHGPVAKPGADRMMLLIDTGKEHAPGWESYSFAVNRTTPGLLERSRGGWDWERVAEIPMRVRGNELYFAIPRATLGLSAGAFTLDFKWVDGLPDPASPMDFYTSGDVVPEGRFRYRYLANP